MTPALALLPCLVVIFGVLVMRWSGLWSAAAAFATATILWASGTFSPFETVALWHAFLDGALLSALVASVIVPGLAYVEICRRAGSLDAIGGVITAMNLNPPRAVIVVVVGVGVMLESLTGFGVSLLVSVPLLLTLVSRERAVPLALIGMSLMPWGALSVAALLGAEIAGLPIDTLAQKTLTTSGPVAFALSLVCLFFSSERGTLWFALISGSALIIGLTLTTYAVGVEVAGVGGGLFVILLATAIAPDPARVWRAIASTPIRLLILLIAVVIFQKAAISVLAVFEIAPAVSTGRVSFSILSSPGLALAATAILGLVFWRQSSTGTAFPSLGQYMFSKSWRPLLTTLTFLTTARLLVETGGIGSLASAVAEVGAYPALAITALLAGVGAYVTGSAVPSAALFMPNAALVGEGLGELALFAAIQHSAAGHTAMASLPIIAILLAAMPAPQPNEESKALRWGLILAAAWLAIVIATGWVQLAWR